jgi:hypothetical protein
MREYGAFGGEEREAFLSLGDIRAIVRKTR